ncbi:hypothetical protein V8F33_000777 [Rhypophila sp. PSN 637]
MDAQAISQGVSFWERCLPEAGRDDNVEGSIPRAVSLRVLQWTHVPKTPGVSRRSYCHDGRTCGRRLLVLGPSRYPRCWGAPMATESAPAFSSSQFYLHNTEVVAIAPTNNDPGPGQLALPNADVDYDVLQSCHHLSSTDPRDVIYAFMGISEDASWLDITIDYDKNTNPVQKVVLVAGAKVPFVIRAVTDDDGEGNNGLLVCYRLVGELSLCPWGYEGGGCEA